LSAEFNFQYSLYHDFCIGGHIVGYKAHRQTEDIIERQGVNQEQQRIFSHVICHQNKSPQNGMRQNNE